jgi:lipopolysaccharide export system permease protein
LGFSPVVIIDRYLISEIAKPLLVACTALVLIFASYSTARFLAEAAQGLLPTEMVVNLILLKALIALEVLLPVGLYLSVVIALGRLHTDSEITALSACGVSSARMLVTVLKLSLFLAVIVGILSLSVRPWAYEQTYWLRAKAESQLDISRLEEASFYETQQGNRIVFVEKIKERSGRVTRMKGIFVQSEHEDYTQVTYADEGFQAPTKDRGMWTLVLRNGKTYRLGQNGEHDVIARFNELTLHLEAREIVPPGYERKSATTMRLAESADPVDIAEYQWRLSTPLTTVLLGLLGVPLSRTAPRQGRYAKLAVAIVIFAVYYNLSAMAKNWVEQGLVAPFPGLWWVSGLLIVVLLASLLMPVVAWRTQRRRSVPHS